jgi:glycosyltransferase involved in cell wall biosynthesis
MILRTHHWPGRVDRWLFQQLLEHANTVAALTPRGAAEVTAAYGVPAISLSPAVDMDVFRPLVPTDTQRPRVLFTGDLGDPRKGGPLLLRAWNEIHRRCPEAVLVLAGPFGLGFDFGFDVYTLERLDLIRSSLARDAVEIPGAGALADLPYQYSRASVSVLPSVDEAFGMVVTESLACGTPVVCSSYGGPGEIVTSPDVGVTVPLKTHADLVSERAARELADAVLAGIELSRQQGIEQRCRAWAESWSLDRVGAATEALLMEIAESSRRGVPRRSVA